MIGLLLGSGVCAMADIQWTLSTVKFANGATASGSFDTNSTFTSVYDVSINVSAGTGTDSFIATSGQIFDSGGETFDFAGTYQDQLTLEFNPALSSVTTTGGHVNITGGSVVEQYNSSAPPTVSALEAGETPTANAIVPEPTAFAFLGAFGSLLGAGAFLRRKFAR